MRREGQNILIVSHADARYATDMAVQAYPADQQRYPEEVVDLIEIGKGAMEIEFPLSVSVGVSRKIVTGLRKDANSDKQAGSAPIRRLRAGLQLRLLELPRIPR